MNKKAILLNRSWTKGLIRSSIDLVRALRIGYELGRNKRKKLT